MGSHRSIGWSAACVALLLAAIASADQVVLKTGQTYSGEITAEDVQTLTLEMSAPGCTITKRFQKSQLASWPQRSREGPAYVAIPFVGEIGKDITTDALRMGLEKATAAHPRYIVLVIDSPGGNVGQMMGMIDLL